MACQAERQGPMMSKALENSAIAHEERDYRNMFGRIPVPASRFRQLRRACCSALTHMIGSIHTGHTSGCLQHHNVQLRAMPVCHAKHSAASYACCKHSGTAQLSTCSVTQKSQHAEHMIGSIHTGHTSGCLQHHNVQLRAMPVCHA